MRLTERLGTEILSLVSQVCKSSKLRQSDYEEAVAEIVAKIVERLDPIQFLQKPLRHYVRFTAKRELIRILKKRQIERSIFEHCEFLNEIARAEARFDADTVVSENFRPNAPNLPEDERRALEQFLAPGQTKLSRREYYLKDKAIMKLRACCGRGVTS